MTDCLNVVIFRPSGAGTGATNITTANSNFSGIVAGGNLYRLTESTYSICASGRGLCRNNHDGSGSQELISDAENFQVLYGIRTNNQMRWVNADSLTDALRENVTQLQVSLVISSPENAATASSNQALPIANLGADTTLAAANDQRIRRVFTTSVELRNRQ
ncbi:hypothetical protein D3C84_690730 [compost metagenome]